jgi:hypothetical protein
LVFRVFRVTVAEVSSGKFDFAGPKKKKSEKFTYPASFQSDPAVPSLSPFFAAQNEVNPTYRPSALERLVLKGAYAKYDILFYSLSLV